MYICKIHNFFANKCREIAKGGLVLQIVTVFHRGVEIAGPFAGFAVGCGAPDLLYGVEQSGVKRRRLRRNRYLHRVGEKFQQLGVEFGHCCLRTAR